MEPKYHIVASTAISGILHAIFNSWALTFASFVTGIFIDIDHFLDYFIVYGPSLDRKNFFSFFYENKLKKATLILHGWEWLLVLILVALLTDWTPWVMGVLIGWCQHMVFDRIFNISTFLSYSLLWRWHKGFDFNDIPLRSRKYVKNKR